MNKNEELIKNDLMKAFFENTLSPYTLLWIESRSVKGNKAILSGFSFSNLLNNIFSEVLCFFLSLSESQKSIAFEIATRKAMINNKDGI